MARQKKNNKVKNSFLATLSIKTLEGCLGELNLKCKFNFSYIDFNQSVAFIDLPGKQQDKLFEKLKDFSNKSLEQWSHERAGKSGLNRFENYGADYDFTIKSAFTRPKIVPTDVEWCRFRLAGKFRVAGFILPPKHIETHCNLDRNTFDVVFIDPEHKLYKTG